MAIDEEDRDTGFVRMPLVEHLAELRRRIIICVIAVTLTGIVAFFLYNPVLHFLRQPYCDAIRSRGLRNSGVGCNLVITDPLEGFTTRLKVTGYLALFFASPVLLWQLWRFITPGLHKREKRYAIPFVAASVVLFALGAVVAILTFPKALDFLIGVSGKGVSTFFSPGRYIGLYVLVIAAFGIAFEFPIVLVFLELAGVVPSKKLKQWRRPAIVVIFVVAAVITPSQDPYSLFAMAIPMTIFYELSILVGKILKK
jgi:sec-independent protein translocase protein TatC